MILDKILGFLFGILNAVLGLFPSWALPFAPAEVGADFGNGLATLAGFFPVKTLGLCLVAVFGLAAVMFVWNLVVWIYDKIPFKMS